ncbi:hypothetical protein, partial [Gilliamella sp. Pas-s95]|uniref:hypothetical protein n=1 Tax=Gilliamella sp. Pas-s95 TaxID=2687317 RepID=UPI001327366C
GYQAWYQQQCQLYQNRKNQEKQSQQTANNPSSTPLPQSLIQTQSSILTDSEPINDIVTNNANKPLTLQHLLFLSSWQPNKYPPMIDSAFIQELKNYFSQ